MGYIKCATFLVVLASAVFAEPPVPGQNSYLPPNQGYNYDRPSSPFPPQSSGNQQSSYRPPSQPSYNPPKAPTPSYGPPAQNTFAPPRPTYGAPSQQTFAPIRTTYAPPRQTTFTTPRPSYGAPSPNAPYPAAVRPGNNNNNNDHDHHEPGMPYDFNYAVKDDYYGTDFSHNAVSDGDVVRGEYQVALPDGRRQIVRYTADWKNGYNAVVTYEGTATYPEPSNNNNQYNKPNNGGGGGGQVYKPNGGY